MTKSVRISTTTSSKMATYHGYVVWVIGSRYVEQSDHKELEGKVCAYISIRAVDAKELGVEIGIAWGRVELVITDVENLIYWPSRLSPI